MSASSILREEDGSIMVEAAIDLTILILVVFPFQILPSGVWAFSLASPIIRILPPGLPMPAFTIVCDGDNKSATAQAHTYHQCPRFCRRHRFARRKHFGERNGFDVSRAAIIGILKCATIAAINNALT